MQVQNEIVMVEAAASPRFKRLSITIVIAAVAAAACCWELIDFPVYYRAAHSMLNHRIDLYAPDFALGLLMEYRYPPFFLLLFLPVSLFEYKIAAYIWSFLLSLMVAGCVELTSFQGCQAGASKRWQRYAMLAMVPYYIFALHSGNAQLVVIFLMYGSLRLYLKGRTGLSALLLSLSITFKIFPVLLLPFFAVKRRWRYLFSVAVFIIALNLIPAFYFGWRGNMGLLEKWYQLVIHEQEFRLFRNSRGSL